MLGFSFIVFGKAAVLSEPGEGALDHPAFGQDFETGIDAFDDFDLQPAARDQRLDPSQKVAGVSTVGEELVHPAT